MALPPTSPPPSSRRPAGYDVFCAHLERSFDLYAELAATLTSERLASPLPGLPSNTIGEQLWCVVGARESYARAIRAGAWAGFFCSLAATGDPAVASEALERSRREVAAALGDLGEWSEARGRLVCDLLEHEAAHHGQLIRYLYALRIPIPPGWKARYSLD